MKAFLFPGQGSQRRGMGEGLFDTVEAFRSQEAAIDALLGYSVRELCLENPQNRLTETQYTQPCLFIVNALHHLSAVNGGATPDVVAGHSLGEYNALFAAGAFDLLTGVRLVKRRGELMARARGGGMAAIIGPDAETIISVLRANGFADVDIANFNAPNQTVISGDAGQITRAAPAFERLKVDLYYPLQVSAAFHSRFMIEASDEFAFFLSDIEFKPMTLPVVANVTGGFYPADAAGQTIRSFLAKQICRPVLWTNSVETLLRAGVSEFREVGPGDVLTRLVNQIRLPVAEPA